MMRSNLPAQVSTLARLREQKEAAAGAEGTIVSVAMLGLFLDLRRSGRSGNSEGCVTPLR